MTRKRWPGTPTERMKDMNTAKQIAMGICAGDESAQKELEKMFGCELENMTDEQKKLGLACLAAFDGHWNQ